MKLEKEVDLAAVLSLVIVFLICATLTEHIWYVHYSVMPMLPKDQHFKIMDPAFVGNIIGLFLAMLVFIWLTTFLYGKRILKYPW
jgi:hypothetical protein